MAKTYTVFKIIERSIILDLCGEAFGRVPVAQRRSEYTFRKMSEKKFGIRKANDTR